MTFAVPIALFGWIPAVLAMYALLPARRAMIASLVAGWLLLPQASYPIPYMPNLDKANVISFAALLGALLFDLKTVLRFRPGWIDLPLLMLCGWAIPSAAANGMGVYPGVAATVHNLTVWGMPWLLGRLYIRDAAALRDLAVAMFVGGVCYIPLCLFEVRMSPTLHYHLYGFHQHQWAQTIRFGGWRPTVFLPHGLDVGIWMASACIIGIALWRSRSMRQWMGLPMGLVLLALLVTTALCKSLGSLMLLTAAIGVFIFVGVTRWRIALLAVVIAAPIYMAGRITNLASRDLILSVMTDTVTFGRQGSLDARLKQEDVLTDRAMQKPLVGWGPWGDFRHDDTGDSLVRATDGMWLILVGKYGLPGLAAFVAALLLPAAIVLIRLPVQTWFTPQVAPAIGLATVITLNVIDSLFNATRNPVIFAVGGALATLAVARLPRRIPRTAPARQPLPAT